MVLGLDPEPEQLAQHDQSNDAAAYQTETTRLMARLNLQQEQPASPQCGVEAPGAPTRAYGPEPELEPERRAPAYGLEREAPAYALEREVPASEPGLAAALETDMVLDRNQNRPSPATVPTLPDEWPHWCR
jgi:hypothetical protein